jgi:hypothetical protein
MLKQCRLPKNGSFATRLVSHGMLSPLFSLGNFPQVDSRGDLAARSVNSSFTNGLTVRLTRANLAPRDDLLVSSGAGPFALSRDPKETRRGD